MKFERSPALVPCLALLSLVALSTVGCRKKKKIDDEVLSIGVGAKHACALMLDKGVRCWGDNSLGQLGDTSREPHPIPVRMVGNTTSFIELEAGGNLTCARTEAHTLDCWGSIRRKTATGEEPVPFDTSSLKDVEQVSIGAAHGCARLEAGTVRCFGVNDHGELGLGNTERAKGTTDVVGLWGAISVCAGREHSCAVTADGTVKCWGRNQEGQLGDGSTKDSASPVSVAGVMGARRVACGGAHSCALLGGGEVRCWGKNDQGQLGDGTRVRHPNAVAVSGLEEQKGISAGDAHTCAFAGDTIRCWGANDQSQMADGTHESRLTPRRITGFSGQSITAVPEQPFAITEVKLGEGFTCVRSNDKRARCWGKNDMGQAGDGTRDVRPVPVDVALARATH